MSMYQFLRWNEDLNKEFQGASDRAAAIVGAAILDAHLRILFEARISREITKAELFDGTNAPLHTLSGKTNLALALGMISTREHRNLTLIRRIRNIFAHQIGGVSFESAEISSRCSELEVPIGMRLPELIPVSVITNANSDLSSLLPVPIDTPRKRFQATVHYTSNCLIGRLLESMGTEVETRQEFERSSEIIDLQIKTLGKMKVRLKQSQARVEELRKEHENLERRIAEEISEKTKAKFIERKSIIEELEQEYNEVNKSEEHQLLEMVDDILTQGGLLEFVRRWESWVETVKASKNNK